MKWASGILMLLFLAWTAPVGADTVTIKDGVLIAHHPSGLSYSPGLDWCEEYYTSFGIDSCGAQDCRIDNDGNTGERSVWYVIAAFADTTIWNAVEFGFGSFKASNYGFVDWGPCYPSAGLEIPMNSWPGPLTGTALVTTDDAYDGSFLPVYYFVGYAYGMGKLPLGVDPAKNFGGTATLGNPSILRAAEAFGAMGLFMDGIEVCPSESRAEEPKQLVTREERRRALEGARRGADNPAIAHVMDTAWVRANIHKWPPKVVEAFRKSPNAEKYGLTESKTSEAQGLKQEGLLFVRMTPGPEAEVQLNLPLPVHVALRAFDATGRLVSMLIDEEMPPGIHMVTWPGQDTDDAGVAAGVYYLRLSLDGRPAGEKKITLVR